MRARESPARLSGHELHDIRVMNADAWKGQNADRVVGTRTSPPRQQHVRANRAHRQGDVRGARLTESTSHSAVAKAGAQNREIIKCRRVSIPVPDG